MVPDYSEWDMKVSKWMGETFTAIDGINKDTDEIKSDLKEIKKQLTYQMIRVGIVSGLMGIIGGSLITIILNSVAV